MTVNSFGPSSLFIATCREARNAGKYRGDLPRSPGRRCCARARIAPGSGPCFLRPGVRRRRWWRRQPGRAGPCGDSGCVHFGRQRPDGQPGARFAAAGTGGFPSLPAGTRFVICVLPANCPDRAKAAPVASGAVGISAVGSPPSPQRLPPPVRFCNKRNARLGLQFSQIDYA